MKKFSVIYHKFNGSENVFYFNTLCVLLEQVMCFILTGYDVGLNFFAPFIYH